MIQRWRLNLWQNTVQERFLEIAQMSDTLFRREFQAREWRSWQLGLRRKRTHPGPFRRAMGQQTR